MAARKADFNEWVGRTFGKLTVKAVLFPESGRTLLSCRCECGMSKMVRPSNLTSGRTLSCGCHRRARMKTLTKTHGYASGEKRTPEYIAWRSMWQRCTNPAHKSFEKYGGAGITICDRWKDFEAFLADMGHRPSDEHSLDRIDGSGNYTPENCRWATDTEQNNNRSFNHSVTYQGRTQSIAEWAAELGMNYGTLRDRLYRGWTAERAFTAPVAHKRCSA